MNISDLLIIYLACGAPCGVYFFLQHRKNLSTKKLWLKSFLTVIVWIPYVFKLLNDFATKKSQKNYQAQKHDTDERLLDLQKLILDSQPASISNMSIFEIREILERYFELTTISQSPERIPVSSEKEIFRVSLRNNIDLGANCLHRRNQQRLLFHQTLARKDFLQMIMSLNFSAIDAEKFKSLIIEFLEMVKDSEALSKIERFFKEKLQSESSFSVSDLEKEVWKPEELKPSLTNQTPIRLRALIASATTRKD